MTASHSKQLEPLPAANNNCNHPRIHPGLDAAYCPDCRSEFKPRSPEYQNALHPPGSSVPLTNYKVGDRVTILRKPPQLLYQIVKLADDGHATVESLIKGTGCDRRRVALWKLRPSCALAAPEKTERPLEDFSSTAPEDAERPLEETPECFNAKPPGSERPLEDFSSTAPEDAERPLEETPECFNAKPPGSERPLEETPEIAQRDSRHTPASGWIEKYSVKGRWEYHRYCWQLGHKGKTRQIHIPKESGKLKAVRDAIAQGKSPLEIVEFLKPCRNKRFEKCSRGRND